MTQIRFSIVINTDGRAASLAATLESLRWLDGPPFEVCVVRGPTEDGTDSVLTRWGGRIKTARCPERNLSISRNIGIALAAGEVVAFLDDDAIPEPEWLAELAPAYADPQTGGAGGFVLNPDGVTYQYRLATVDRLGRADLSWSRPVPELCFPLTAAFPHLLGANSSFRRTALLDVGGFDEEYEYFLDETDVICRMVDAGWMIAQVEGAHVHHKFLPSALRKAPRVLTAWYPVIKNRIYFSLANGLAHHSVAAIIEDVSCFVEGHAHDVERAIAAGRLDGSARARFRAEVDQAWDYGLTRGLAGSRRIPGPDRFAATAPPFLPFTTNAPPNGRRCFCFTADASSPGGESGTGRCVHALARSEAALGHQVHMLMIGEGHDRVDFDQGVWVHRVVVGPQDEAAARALGGPFRSAADEARLRREVALVASRRPVAAVWATGRDGEGRSILRQVAPCVVV